MSKKDNPNKLKKKDRSFMPSYDMKRQRKIYQALLWTAISLLIVGFFFTFLSFVLTICSFSDLHNQGMDTQEVWRQIAKNWWSFVRVVEPEGTRTIYLTYSWFSILIMVIGGIGIVLLIPIIVNMAKEQHNIKARSKIIKNLKQKVQDKDKKLAKRKEKDAKKK